MFLFILLQVLRSWEVVDAPYGHPYDRRVVYGSLFIPVPCSFTPWPGQKPTAVHGGGPDAVLQVGMVDRGRECMCVWRVAITGLRRSVKLVCCCCCFPPLFVCRCFAVF